MPNEPCKCIDISHYQGRPNFATVREYGVLAMIHKATEGLGYADPDRAHNCANAMKAGIVCCTYHFLRPGDMEGQMDFFCNVVEPVSGERLVLDHEDPAVSLSDLKACVSRLLDKDLNLQITVYSGHVLKQQLGSKHDAFLADNTDLWVCHYGVSKPTWPTGTYPIYSLWQYSDQGSIPGISTGYVDLNEFNGSDQNLVRWIGPAGGEPIQPLPPVAEQATVNIQIETEGDVIVTVNGVPIEV